MASKISLIFATILLCCLSCSTSIRELNVSKHLVIENDSKLGFNGGPQAIKSAGNSSGSITEERVYIHTAGYQSKATLWHGVRAIITTWQIPEVQPKSSSGAYIAVISESSTSTQRELIAAGVHVNPSMYQDNEVHYFTYWTTTSDYSTGCFNRLCPGFVASNDINIFPGAMISPPHSTYNGDIRSITLRIKKDENTGDWSLYRENTHGPIDGMTLLGWWPSSLFKTLSGDGNIIQWSGYVNHLDSELAPPMGSGHFSSEVDRKAASFDDCYGFDTYGDPYTGDYKPLTLQDKPQCYDVSDWYQTKKWEGRHFFYGGPSRCAESK